MGIGNIADTGMQAAMSNMEVISNNIANANTIGFKKSYINFADIYPSSNGASGNQIGLGVEVAGVNQDFSKGGTINGNGSLDLAIQRAGFFTLKDPTTGQLSYTRAGRFNQDPNGYIVFGNTNQHLQGFQAVNGVIPPGAAISDLTFNTATLPAQASTVVNASINLDSSQNPPSVSPFDPTNTATFNYNVPSYIVDSLGNQHTVMTYYVKTGVNTWDANVYVDNVASGSGSLTFNGSGQLTSGSPISVSFTPTTGANSPQAFTINLSGSTQVSGANAVNLNSADGYAAGKFSSLSVDSNGMVKMLYTNGQNLVAGQIAIANFPSVSGLADVGNMQWVETANSGSAIFNQNASTSNIQANQLESSNVDLTSEMVNLINAQHTFQANAQVEQTYNDVMKTVIQL